jgi:hypothetical protein
LIDPAWRFRILGSRCPVAFLERNRDKRETNTERVANVSEGPERRVVAPVQKAADSRLAELEPAREFLLTQTARSNESPDGLDRLLVEKLPLELLA